MQTLWNEHTHSDTLSSVQAEHPIRTVRIWEESETRKKPKLETRMQSHCWGLLCPWKRSRRRKRNKAGHYHAIVFGILVPNIILVQSQQGTFPECQSPMGPLSYHLCTTIPLLSLAPLSSFSSFPLLLLAPASFPYFCLLAESEADINWMETWPSKRMLEGNRDWLIWVQNVQAMRLVENR